MVSAVIESYYANAKADARIGAVSASRLVDACHRKKLNFSPPNVKLLQVDTKDRLSSTEKRKIVQPLRARVFRSRAGRCAGLKFDLR